MGKNSILKQSLLLLLALIILVICDSIAKFSNSYSKITKKISSSIERIENEQKILINECENNIEDYFHKVKRHTNEDEEKTEIALYVFCKERLIYWNSDMNDPEQIFNNNKSEKSIFKQGNFTYLVSYAKNDTIEIYASTPLYYSNPNFADKNKFIPEKIKGSYSMQFSIEDNKVQYEIEHTQKMDSHESYFIGFILLSVYIICIYLIYNILKTLNKDNTRKQFWLFLISSVIFFLIFSQLQKLLYISTSDMFGKSCLTSSSNISFSLGILAEFSILIMAISIMFYNSFNNEIKLKTHTRVILSSTLFIFIILTYTYLIYILISNTNIHFSFLQLYDTTPSSYIFLIIICIITSSAVFILQSIVNIIISKEQSFLYSLLAFLIVGMIMEIAFNYVITLNYSLVTNIVGILIYLTMIWYKKSPTKIKSLLRNILLISLITTQLTYILYLINETKEREEMRWFANVIANESDKAFEDKILEIVDKIKADNNLIDWEKKRNFPSDDSILNYLESKYFNIDEIKSYNKVVTLCDTNTILIFEEDYEIKCHELFDNIFSHKNSKKVSEELYLIDDATTDSYYILRVLLSPADVKDKVYCNIEFYKEYILSNIGIPEIISSYENVLQPNLSNYSFSCYEDSILQYKYGNYNYPNDLENFRFNKEEYAKSRIFKHLNLRYNERKTIIVTVEKPRFIEIIAPFSYIFIILLLIYYFNVKIERRKNLSTIKESFHDKIQMTILMTLGLSFAVAGVSSFWMINNSLHKKTFEFQLEKNKTIVKNIEEKINGENAELDYNFINNYKDTFFTDINIYDTNGRLLNTTQPKLFEGHKARIINRDAYEAIKMRNRFYYSTDEKIDDIEFVSSYIPLRDKNGNLMAIINIPYFDNSMVSKSSMSIFIITYLNIILVLMGLSAVVMILTTRKTLKPLEIIQDKMKKISLGGKNEAIEWKSNDEIGNLIEIYNKLIKELEISANNLMRSERETAWREMARQVAHEIKNPLTPMKLNIQFLQMAWDEKNPDIDKKLKDTTKTLLEQIEILSNIATAFSDYAKLPKNKIETFKIKELIVNTINLYNNEGISISLTEENESDYMIDSDKNNLSIVFGNILKNAIQAISNEDEGEIRFSIKDEGESYHIEVSDNGCGIGEEEKKKIFMPNFTTKSSGMGVGLSIVYDILQTLNGEISFVSEVGKGTTFIIDLKK